MLTWSPSELRLRARPMTGDGILCTKQTVRSPKRVPIPSTARLMRMTATAGQALHHCLRCGVLVRRNELPDRDAKRGPVPSLAQRKARWQPFRKHANKEAGGGRKAKTKAARAKAKPRAF